MPGSGGLGVPGPAGEVQSVPAPSVLCPPHPVSEKRSLGDQEPHLLGEEEEGGSSYAFGPDPEGLDLKGKQLWGVGSSWPGGLNKNTPEGQGSKSYLSVPPKPQLVWTLNTEHTQELVETR